MAGFIHTAQETGTDSIIRRNGGRGGQAFGEIQQVGKIGGSGAGPRR